MSKNLNAANLFAENNPEFSFWGFAPRTYVNNAYYNNSIELTREMHKTLFAESQHKKYVKSATEIEFVYCVKDNQYFYAAVYKKTFSLLVCIPIYIGT